MSITKDQYNAAVELKKRGNLTPEQDMAATEIINRFSASLNQSGQVAAEIQRTALLGPASRIENIPEQTDIGALIGSIMGGAALEMQGAKTGKNIGGVVGALVGKSPGAMKTGQTIGAVSGALFGSAFGSGVGATTGDYGEQLARNLLSSSSEFNTSFGQAVQKGEKEAVYDFIGNLIFRSGGGVIRKILGSPTRKGAEEAAQIMERYDSSLAFDQVVDRAIFEELGSAMRGGLLTKGVFTNLDESQDRAIISFFNDFINTYSSSARETLTNEGVGRLILTTLKSGEDTFDNAAAQMFAALDNAVVLRSTRPTEVFQEVAPAMRGVRDKPAGRMVAAQRLEAPVDVSSVREWANNFVTRAKRIGDVDPTGEGTALMKKLANGDARLTFAEVHTLISDLKRLQRSGRIEDLPAGVKVGDAIAMLQKSFDDAGNSLGGDLTAQYKRMQNFYRFGKSRFNNEFVAQMMKSEFKDSAAMGNLIVGASQGDLIRLRGALRLADKQKGLDPGTSWKTVQSAFLDKVLPRNPQEIANAPIFNLATDRQLQLQLSKVFSSQEMEILKRNADLIRKNILDVRQGSSSLSGRQAGAATRAIYTGGLLAVGGGAAFAGSGIGFPIMAYLATPYLLSHAMVNPNFTRAVAAWDNAMRVTGPGKGTALVKATRLATEVYNEIISDFNDSQAYEQ